ncbi:hypothetical protein SSTU70S_04745 [Stutzerimonas stutzeri]
MKKQGPAPCGTNSVGMRCSGGETMTSVMVHPQMKVRTSMDYSQACENVPLEGKTYYPE